MNDKYSAIVKRLDQQRLTVDINEELNIERLQTMYYDYDGPREVELRFIDPRRFTAEQRRFIYALLGDIYDFTGQPIESLKEIFKWRYEAITGRRISLSNISTNTVLDGKIKGSKIGKSWQIKKSEVDYVINNGLRKKQSD